MTTREHLIECRTDASIPVDDGFTGADGDDVVYDPVAVLAGVWSGADVRNKIKGPLAARATWVADLLDRYVGRGEEDAVGMSELVSVFNTLGSDDGVVGQERRFRTDVEMPGEEVDSAVVRHFGMCQYCVRRSRERSSKC